MDTDEIVLKIFQYLEKNDLGICLQVSQRFQNVAKDKTLWKTIALCNKRISTDLIVHALKYGLQRVILFNCTVMPGKLKYPKKKQLEELTLCWNIFTNGEDILNLLLSCCEKAKIYVLLDENSEKDSNSVENIDIEENSEGELKTEKNSKEHKVITEEEVHIEEGTVADVSGQVLAVYKALTYEDNLISIELK